MDGELLFDSRFYPTDQLIVLNEINKILPCIPPCLDVVCSMMRLK